MVVELLLVGEIAALALLLLGSAFFSMSETAFISAKRVQIRQAREEGDARAATLERLLQDPESLITTVLVGNNIVNIAASVLSAVIAVQLLGALGPAVATGVMVFLVLIFAEITPKTYAVRHATGLALRVARPLALAQRVLSPVVWIFSKIANAVLRAFGIPPGRRAPFVTEEEIKLLLRVGEEQGTIERFERRVINEVFEFAETKAHRVMTPREEIVFVPREARLLDAVRVVNESGFSRILVVDSDLDHVAGFFHSKDLLRYNDPEVRTTGVDEIMRPVLIVPSTVETDDLLLRMQRLRTYLAVVQDRDDRTIGIITVEDLVEELVGEIEDEFDVPASGPGQSGSSRGAPSSRRST